MQFTKKEKKKYIFHNIAWHKPWNQQINNRLNHQQIPRPATWSKTFEKNASIKMYFIRINSGKREKLRTWKLFCLRKNPEPELPGVNSVKGGEELVHGRKGRGLCAGRSEIQGLMSLTFIRVIITGITALIWRPWHARFYFKHSFKLLIFVSVLRQLHFSLMQPLFQVNPALSQIKK